MFVRYHALNILYYSILSLNNHTKQKEHGLCNVCSNVIKSLLNLVYELTISMSLVSEPSVLDQHCLITVQFCSKKARGRDGGYYSSEVINWGSTIIWIHTVSGFHSNINTNLYLVIFKEMQTSGLQVMGTRIIINYSKLRRHLYEFQ